MGPKTDELLVGMGGGGDDTAFFLVHGSLQQCFTIFSKRFNVNTHRMSVDYSGNSLFAVADIEERNNGRYNIVIPEVPYGMSKEDFIDKVRDLVLSKKLDHIADARDESARGKVRVVVELKKDAFPKKILNQL